MKYFADEHWGRPFLFPMPFAAWKMYGGGGVLVV